MEVTVTFLLCVCTVAHFLFPPIFACEQNQQIHVELEADQPFIRVEVNKNADLKCCYKPIPPTKELHQEWVIRFFRDNNITTPGPVPPGPRVSMKRTATEFICHHLALTDVQLNDTGFYQCFLTTKDASLKSCKYSHGTYLQVYTPLPRTLDISESWKNSIITMEGVLLLFAVLIPGICQLGKTKRLTQLNRKKQREEENIYEGLNLDDCNSTYHQIQRTNRHGPYQDVANTAEDDIQFEKP